MKSDIPAKNPDIRNATKNNTSRSNNYKNILSSVGHYPALPASQQILLPVEPRKFIPALHGPSVQKDFSNPELAILDVPPMKLLDELANQLAQPATGPTELRPGKTTLDATH